MNFTLPHTFKRWLKFNLVGAMGMAAQLTALAILNLWMPGHYLFATAVAVELAVLHNFVWHMRFTWRDRRDKASTLTQLLRFHLSNGLVSLLGNLVVMRTLIHEVHIPLLAANGVAILTCSMANFHLGHTWTFADHQPLRRTVREA